MVSMIKLKPYIKYALSTFYFTNPISTQMKYLSLYILLWLRYVWKRILFEEKKISQIDINGWHAEIERLQASYHAEYETYKNLNAEIKTLRDINKFIDEAIRGDKPKKREEFVR
ncbi:hypothetical protein UYO_2815 [Lachnospiraceae bacterium JC7]|nr:hypothetical protein UYO_2815 [Lachnospiraceae bacterium JC7]